MKKKKNWLSVFVIGLLVVVFGGQQLDWQELFTDEPSQQIEQTEQTEQTQTKAIIKGERYSSPEEVAAYLNQYNELPPNYLTKREAAEKGWDNEEGNLWEVTEQMSIGGDRFGNYEGILPEKEDRVYYEADVNYKGGHRGPERLVYSNDDLIFYTDDHYETFEQLY